MKKIYKTLFIMLLIMITSGSFASAYAGDYDINDYQVKINVLENGMIEVEEILTVYFFLPRHGIYREIPMIGTFKREINGKKLNTRYIAQISNLYVENHRYSYNRQWSNLIIKIGDESKFIAKEQTYKINYTIYFGDDDIEGFDEFYFNVIGENWDTTIHHAEIFITMPKDFDESKISIMNGYTGTIGSNNVEYKIENNTIHIETTQKLPAKNGVTIRVELGNGYFEYLVEPEPLFNSDIIYIIMGILVLAMLILWLSVGKSPKLNPLVEFYPPEDMTPAEIGYIFDGRVDDKDVVSLLIYWADKKYIKIEKDSNNNFLIIKKKDLSLTANKYENEMFENLFKVHKDAEKPTLKSVKVNDLKNMFYTTIYKVKQRIRNKYANNKDKGIYTRTSKIARKIAIALSTTPYLLSAFKAVNPPKSYIAPFLMVFIVGSIFLHLGFQKFNEIVIVNIRSKSFSKSINALLFPIYILLPFYFMASTIFAFTQSFIVIYVVLGSITVLGTIAANMENPTQETIKMRERILGFRSFLENAEKDRINALVEENPMYFFNILPYAYVLGVTDKWANQFEHIAMEPPGWYVDSYSSGYFSPSSFGNSFSRSFDSISNTMASGSGGRSSSSGGSSGGGSW